MARIGVASLAGVRARRQWSGRARVCALLLLFAGSASLGADGPGSASAASAQTGTGATQGDCGSVVIRHCQPRAHIASVVVDTTHPSLRQTPVQWETVHEAGPDADDIVVVGARVREPTPTEVFERYLGAHSDSAMLITREASGGARCTTISRGGGTLCSVSGGGIPGGTGTPVVTWSLSF